MPSVSKAQQRLFGLVKSCQETGKCPSPKIKAIAKSMSAKEVKAFAKTKHKNLPEKVSEGFLSFSQYLRLREGKTECKCKCVECLNGDCKSCSCKNCDCEGCKCS